MATQTDPNRPSTGPLNTQQRQRLEALQFAKALIGRTIKVEPYQTEKVVVLEDLMDLADYIVSGDR